MSDRGVNAVDRGEASVDDVLTPRLAARFERVLATDEDGGDRAATRVRADRLGPGLFEVAMRGAPSAPTIGQGAREAVDPAVMRAFCAAGAARGREILAAAEGDASEGNIDAGAEPRLAGAAGAATTMEALFERAVAGCNEVAVSAGTDATLAWFLRVAPSIDARLERLALGVVAAVPDRGPSTRDRAPDLGERLVAARVAITARRRAREELAQMLASRDAMLASAEAEAQVVITAAIEVELLASLRAIESTRVGSLGDVARWLDGERRRVEAEAQAAQRLAHEVAEAARHVSIEEAHRERLAELAVHHEVAQAAIERATADHDAATVGVHAQSESLRVRWEHKLDDLARVDDQALRSSMTRDGLALHNAAIEEARQRAAKVEGQARATRDATITRAEDVVTETLDRIEARYRKQLGEIARVHDAAERAANGTIARAIAGVEREALVRRAAIERDATEAVREAHARATRRREGEVEAAARAASDATRVAIDERIAAFEHLIRGGRP